MAELRQLVAYAFALTIVLFLLTFGVRVSFVEAARYLPLTAPPETNSLNRAAELVSAPAVHVASAQPVWIVPTPKYQYDPKLMIAKSNEDRQKEAEVRRAKELASYQANKRGSLEVVDHNGTSTVWSETFATDRHAHAALIETLETEGIRSFSDENSGWLH